MDPYAGADLTNARRMTGLLALTSAALAIAFLPLSPPHHPNRVAGWAIAITLILVTIAIAAILLDARRRVSFDHLLGVSYLALAFLALGVWATGGSGSVFDELFLVALVAGAGVHPPRRAIPLLGALVVAGALPLLYDDRSSAAASDTAAHLLVWVAVGVGVMVLMVRVRSQRIEMTERESHQAGLARVDSLTGLGNRRAFEEALKVEGARSGRSGSVLSLLVLDVDEFKSINDAFGHDSGDHVLRHVADTLLKEARAADRVFRWGGDEFAMLLPDTDHEGATQACARIAAAVTRSCSTPDGTPLHVSCGASVLSGDGVERLLAEADAALYGRKQERATAER